MLCTSDKTNPCQLVNMANRLMKASLKSKIAVNICLVSDSNNPHFIRVNIVFFRGDDNFTIFLYGFRSEEKNNEFMDMAIDLMLDPSRYEEIKEQSKDY